MVRMPCAKAHDYSEAKLHSQRQSTPGSQFQRPQGVTALHTPLLTVVVPGANPGAGTNSTEHVRHRRGNGPENRCADHRRPECDSLVLRHFHPSVAQQQSIRLITERPWSVTTPRDPFLFIAGWLRQMSGGLKIRRGWRATNSSDHFIAALM